MVYPFRRLSRLVLSLFVVGALSGCALFDRTATPARPQTPWLYRGSDVPVDSAWLFGELPNGLRYAIRRNGVPPGQVAVRVRIDAGSLMETDAERGFAHYIEHLSFRGSTHVPDGEAKRIWQRLGATFGSDSNAQTTPTQTVYKLDLPNATPPGLNESLKILAGMMSGPLIDASTVGTERPVLMAEAREQFGPSVRLGEATRALFFAGQPLATRSPIGTPETLAAATPETLSAFHRRWYRPDRAVVVIAGDGDPRVFEAMLRQHFAAWRNPARRPPEPDFGKPRADGPDAAVIVEPALPAMITLATLRPWVKQDDTVIYNEGMIRDMVAIRLINRRLESRARAGGSFLQAQVDREKVSRSADGTFTSIMPIGEDWRMALKDVRTVIAEASMVAPTQAEIDREVEEFDAALAVGVETAASEAGSKQADDLVEAVDIREAVASPQVALDIFRGMKAQFTPERMLASTKSLFSGADTRALLSIPKADDGAQAALVAALAEDVSVAAKARAELPPIGFDRVPVLGTPGQVVTRETVADLGAEFVELSNGMRLVLFPNKSEAGKVLVSARFGNGYLALPSDRPTPIWAAPMALVQSGIGDLGQEELDRLTTGRRINMGIAIEEDSFALKAVTRASDLKDQLHLLAAKLAAPGWDPNPVIRARAGMLASYDSASASPLSVLGRDLPGLLRGGDPRWASPTREQIAALDPASFRALWEPLLATGPIELMIFGDFDTETALRHAEATFGAMPRRDRPAISPAALAFSFPAPNPTPVEITHSGPADQSAALIVWPTGGGIDTLFESRKLDVLAAIFSDRLFDRLRQVEGASYSPNVQSDWPTAIDKGGYFLVGSALKPDSIDIFYKLAREIAADLAAQPVAQDELQRAVGPLIQYTARASSGNSFWLDRLSGASWDRRRLDAIRSLPTDLRRITPADVQAAARTWLVPGKSWSVVVRAETAAGN